MRTDTLSTLTEVMTGRTCLGRVVGVDENGQPLVDFPGNEAGPVSALATITVPTEMIAGGRDALIVFVDDDPPRPVVVGLIQDQPVTPFPKIGKLEPRAPIEVSADGRRLVLFAYSELHFVCGESSITLRKDGKVVINGRHVLSRAKVVNRIKGGSVQIN
jgi:hypothetical protein